MLEQLKYNIGNSSFYVLGIFSKDEDMSYYLLCLDVKDDELIIKERYHSNSLNIFNENNLKKDLPIILHLEGDDVISKSLENTIGYRKNLIFNANADDFHFFEYSQSDTIFASIVRKSYIDELLNTLSVSGVFVVGLTFGPFVLANLLTMLNQPEVSLSYNTLKLKEGKIISFSKTKETHQHYQINDENLNSKEVSLMGAFLGYKYANPLIENDNDFLLGNKNELKFKKLFKTIGISSLALIIIALFIGHFLLKHYSVSLAEKSTEYAAYQQTMQLLNGLNQEKTLKEKILLTSGINNQGFITKHVQGIGNSVPEDIRLLSVKTFPLVKKIREGERIGFELNVISILGETTNDGSFNEWIIALKQKSWVKKIDILEYIQDEKRMNSFSLNISI